MDDSTQNNQSQPTTQPAQPTNQQVPVAPPVKSVVDPVPTPTASPDTDTDQKTLPDRSAPRQVQAPVASPVVHPPVGAPANKEHEPGTPHSKLDVDKMSESEIVEEEKVVEKELEALVEKSPDTEKPEIPKEVQAAGVTHAKENTPMPQIASGTKSLPMSFQDALATQKKYKWRNSITWFASLVMYHWKKIGLTNSSKSESDAGLRKET